MKNKRLTGDLARIKTVIEGDRKSVSCDVENMLKYDLMCVLRGYFETCTPPQIEIDGARGGIRVTVTLYAHSVKSAGVRPSDPGQTV